MNKCFLLVAIALCFFAGSSSSASAQTTASIYSCYHKTNGQLRKVNSIAECKPSEIALIWNAQGPQGSKGDQGIQGIQGPKGDKGDKGDTGARGAQGEQGAQGVQGLKGERGDKGDAGEPGPQGEQGTQGVQGLNGDKGAKGDKGDRGDAGERGQQGEQGTQGVQGLQGLTGAHGDRGDKGDQGDRGAAGENGEKGDTGPAGQSAFQFFTGRLKLFPFSGHYTQYGYPMGDSEVILADPFGALMLMPDEPLLVKSFRVTVAAYPDFTLTFRLAFLDGAGVVMTSLACEIPNSERACVAPGEVIVPAGSNAVIMITSEVGIGADALFSWRASAP